MSKRTITIERITRKAVPGKKWRSLGLRIKGFDGWINGFDNDWNSHWKEGDTVEVDIVTAEKNGKTYYNLVSPPREGGHSGPNYSDLMREIQNLRADIASLAARVGEAVVRKTMKSDAGAHEGELPLPPNEEIPPPRDEDQPGEEDDLPF